jgi:hypothetical protein
MNNYLHKKLLTNFDSISKQYENIPISSSVISLSLFGSTYYLDCLCTLVPQILFFHPDFTIVIHTTSIFHQELSKRLSSLQNIYIVVVHEECIPFEGLYWRHAILNHGFRRCVVRDVDSYWTERDAAILEDWVTGNQPFHIIRDGTGQTKEIMAGLYGVQNAKVSIQKPIIYWLIKQTKRNLSIENDQQFLRHVYPYIYRKASVYSSHNIFFTEVTVHHLPMPSFSDLSSGAASLCGQQPIQSPFNTCYDPYDNLRSLPKHIERIHNHKSILCQHSDKLNILVPHVPLPCPFKSLLLYLILKLLCYPHIKNLRIIPLIKEYIIHYPLFFLIYVEY